MKLCPKEKNSSRRNFSSPAGGFTLIELMVVVGIISILIMIAGPKYERYQAKARQSEAKLGLAAVYAAEKAFYSEYGAYIPAMANALGYIPEGQKRFYYIGWNGSSWTHAVTGYSGTYVPIGYNRINYPSDFTGCAGGALTDGTRSTHIGPGFPDDDPQMFIVGANGEIRLGGGCDSWTIDELKALRNLNDGL